ncbi:MAG: DegT/DnrJ/EryC1/StrS family aminotransferase, partial [Clostridia bacterium]
LPKLHALRGYELAALNTSADRYTAALSNAVATPTVRNGFTSSWAQYTILLRDSAQRARVQSALKAQGIPTMIYYPRCIHQQTAYADRAFTDADYPNAVFAAERVLSLPMHPYLRMDEVDTVCEALLTCLRGEV